MSIRDAIRRFAGKADQRTRDIHAATVVLAHESIQTGSSITGAPGQPVDTGALRSSWTFEFTGPVEARISTPMEYAQAIEDNVRGVTFKNHGPHSVRLTRAGLPLLVEEATRRVGNG